MSKVDIPNKPWALEHFKAGFSEIRLRGEMLLVRRSRNSSISRLSSSIWVAPGYNITINTYLNPGSQGLSFVSFNQTAWDEKMERLTCRAQRCIDTSPTSVVSHIYNNALKSRSFPQPCSPSTLRLSEARPGPGLGLQNTSIAVTRACIYADS